MRCLIYMLGLSFHAIAAPDVGEMLEDFASSLPIVHQSAGFDPALKHPGWKPQRFLRSPEGNRDLFGVFLTGEKATLRIRQLPPHDVLLIRLDLVILCHWDGVWETYGPDRWTAAMQDGPVLLHASFSNFSGAKQNFPDEVGPSIHPWRTGMASHGELGWKLQRNPDAPVWGGLDTTYHLWMAVHHRGSEAVLNFSGSFHDNPDPPDLKGECWAISACKVHVLPTKVQAPPQLIQAAALSAFTEEAAPHPAAIAALVLARPAQFPLIEKVLSDNKLHSLVREANVNSEKGTSRISEILVGLSSEDFKTREQSSSQLQKLLPSQLEAVEKALASATDPEIRERLGTALQDFHKSLKIPQEKENPSFTRTAIARLDHVLRLHNFPEARKWRTQIDLLKKRVPSD